VRDDQNKPKMSLIDPNFEEQLARVLELGEVKYDGPDWKKGMDFSIMIDAAIRHLNEIRRHQFYDKESKQSHMAHVAANMMMLNYYMDNYSDYDVFDNLKWVPPGNFRKRDQIGDLQERITSWADTIFPDRTPYDALRKMVLEEIPELLHEGLDDPEEWADVFILMFDAANLRGIDIVKATNDKMTKNEARKWKLNKETGLMNHVKSD